jgi:hypothetical protein
MTEQENRWMELGKAIERAAGELPEGFDLYVELERGAGVAVLHLPDTDASKHDFDGDTLADHINAAIDYAIANDSEHED